MQQLGRTGADWVMVGGWGVMGWGGGFGWGVMGWVGV